eukprot:1666936-Karenia_brevis.AAC.1
MTVKKAKAKACPAPTNAVPFKCPAILSAPVAPMIHNGWSVYTDVKQKKWRCKKIGERKDTASSWVKDKEAAW